MAAQSAAITLFGFRELQEKNDPYKTPKYSGGRSSPLYFGDRLFCVIPIHRSVVTLL